MPIIYSHILICIYKQKNLKIIMKKKVIQTRMGYFLTPYYNLLDIIICYYYNIHNK